MIRLLILAVQLLSFGLVTIGTSTFALTDETTLPQISFFEYQKSLGINEIVLSDYRDFPLVELNNHTLNEVFVDGLINQNSDFNDTSWWSVSGESVIENGYGKIISTAGAYSAIVKSPLLTVGNQYYFRLFIYSIVDNLTLSDSFSGIVYTSTGLKTFKSTALVPQLVLKRSTTVNAWVDYIMGFDLTALGISSLSVAQMDSYYSQFLVSETITSDGVVYGIGDGFIMPVDLAMYQDFFDSDLLTLDDFTSEDFSIERGYEYTFTRNTVFEPLDVVLLLLSIGVWALIIKAVRGLL